MNLDSKLLYDATTYVSKHFAEHLPPQYTFHNMAHTLQVVKACDILCTDLNIDDRHRHLIHLAALFHDTGYTKGEKDHEETSANLAKAYLEQKQVDADAIAIVQQLIRATRKPSVAITLHEQILCDADMSHLASPVYANVAKQLREEWIHTKGVELSDKKWIKENIAFLAAHMYYTSSGRDLFEKKKNKNLKWLNAELKQLKNPEKQSQLPDGKKQKTGESKFERGVETLFRVMANNHMRLSDMADNKANLLITINALVISIVLSVLSTKLDTNPRLIIPTLVIVLVNISTITISILATRPKIKSTTIKQQENTFSKINFLFFGNIHAMPFTDYQGTMWEIINNKKELYNSLLYDNYLLSKVLIKKYKFLKLAYNVFMLGMIMAILSFIWSIVFIYN